MKTIVPSLLAAILMNGCGSGLSENKQDGGSPGSDALSGCAGPAPAQVFELPPGNYKAQLSAADTKTCGFVTDPASFATETLEVAVTSDSVTVAPNHPGQMQFTRVGNKLCGGGSREYRNTINGVLCILNEQFELAGEVRAKGDFWFDFSFSWTKKGGDCTAVTLPCNGTKTWTLVSDS